MRASTESVARETSPDAAKSKCPLVAELSAHVKENSRSGIVSCLTRIKSDQKCFQRLLENGGVGLLVELLRYRNVKVLDTALSILANACLLSNVREEVQGTKIATYAVWIVKNLHSGETLHCRACRLMGNLADSSYHAKSLCEAGAITVLTETVRSKTNAQTLGMAVRAVRNIWNAHEPSRDEILEAETIKAISSLLVQTKKKLLERDDDAKYVELGETCLKAMHVFVNDSDSRSGEQMRGEKGLHGYRCIVDYCRANNKTAIKCLYKLSRNPERRPDLGCSGAVEFLVEAVKTTARNSVNSKFRNSPSWEIIVSLCLFCREAVNRAKIRNCSGLEAMLERLGEIRDEKYHPMLLNGLAQFLRDDQSIAIMVKNGLIEVLVEKLKKMSSEAKTSAATNERSEKNGKKRGADGSTIVQSDVKYNRTNERFERFSLDYPRYDWSPGSTSNGYSSPPSTPPMSPCEIASDLDENADDNYSPICSDNEWLENDDTNEAQDSTESERMNGNVDNEDGDTVFPDPEEPESNFDDKHDDDDEGASSSSVETREHASHAWTLALLSMLSYSNDPIDGLSDPTTIQALIGYISAAKNYRASVILARIVRNPAYFVPLLLQGFVFEAQTLYGTEQYTRALCELAETGGAFGELASLLLRGQESQRFIVALSIPFVVKTREKLRILLNNHGGLDLIFNILKNSKNSLYDEAIVAISGLALSLKITGPEIRSKKSFANGIDEFGEKNDVRGAEKLTGKDVKSSINVIFELDDGSTVETSRTVLCEKSAVFSAMLEGSFNESGKNRVRLKKASNDGLVALLSITTEKNCQKNHHRRKNNRIRKNNHRERSIEALLDAVLLADQFLMSEVSDELTEISVSRLNHENLSRAWIWSKKNSCHELKNCCVKIFLTSTMTRDQRLRAFRDFSEMNDFEDFIDDVRRIIDDSLASRV